MYSVLKRTLSVALVALILTGMAFQAAAEEAQAPSAAEASVEAVVAGKAPADATEPEPNKAASEEPEAPEPEALEPRAEAAAESAVEPEAIDETELPELVEIPDEPVPLAGGPEPSVSVRASRDVGALHIGDSLVLTCELSGFGGLEYAIRWQARVNGKWKDLPGESSDTLVVRITDENADWAYRAAVDAQPV